ncbi:hypothetical protein ACOSYY_12360, partial [Nitrospira sp. BLG_2]
MDSIVQHRERDILDVLVPPVGGSGTRQPQRDHDGTRRRERGFVVRLTRLPYLHGVLVQHHLLI